MRVTIGSSSNELISNEYKESATKVCEYLASNNCDLNWGAGDTSIMAIWYEVFANYNRKIYGYTSPKYVDLLTRLPKAESKVYDTTFDLRKNMFQSADFIVFLPGGTGTMAELFSFIEEIRSNDPNKPLIIYNENHHYDEALNVINDLVKRSFSDETIYNYFKVANSFEEFKEIVSKILT